ncbi:MAG: methyltransferase domain-containing protein [Candidatus Aenigmarchaeota archaeon]|nr:methyltransferase domain-containing protein [Candidatus Aenigmarchaeota archaeon]
MDPRSFYDATAAVYDVRHASPATRLLRERERALVKRYGRGPTLDLGCGTGVHLQSGMVGLDVSGRMLARARGKAALVQGSEQLPFADASFRSVLCFFTVLNMADPQLLAKECWRVLRPGGRLLLSVASVWDHAGLPGKTLRVAGSRLRLRLFTLQKVAALFSGFALEHADSLFRGWTPQWGQFRPWSPGERKLLAEEKEKPVDTGGIYLLVFRRR